MKICGFDVETLAPNPEHQLQPWRKLTNEAVINSCAAVFLSDEGYEPVAIMRPQVNDLRAILRRCADEKWFVAAWNAPFDIAWCLAYGLREEVFACKWLDGELLWRHACVEPEPETRRKKSFGLKAAVTELLPKYAGYEDGVEFAPSTPEGEAALLRYNTMDSYFTAYLVRKFLTALEPSQLRAALLEAVCLPMVGEANLYGLHVDRDKAAALSGMLLAQQRDAYDQLLKIAPEVAEVDLSSSQQLSRLLFETWGIPVHKRTEKGAASTDKEALSYIGDKDPRARILKAHRDAGNLLTKFVEAPLKSLDYNGGVTTHPQARVFGTYTGRMTYNSKQGKGKQERQTGIALHQWKRDKDFRALIVPPPGYVLVEYDFSGQEYRWMGVLSGDETILQMCQPGEDGHCFMGARIARMDYREMMQLVAANEPRAKLFRQGGKVSNLSLQYRMSAKTLRTSAKIQYGLELSEEDAIYYHKLYTLTYPRVPEYWADSIARAKRYGYAETVAGRRVQLTGQWLGRAAYAQEQTAINYRIQGTGADQKYLALAVARNHLPRFDGRFYFELHDGLFFIFPEARAKEAVPYFRHLLSNLPYKRAWGIDLPIQFPVDCKVGPSWGALVEQK